MSSWHSYPSVYALGHKAIENLFKDPVLVEEKIDGSQMSFGRFNKELKVKSKGKEMYPEAPENLFEEAVKFVSTLDLHDGWTYRGECLKKPHHNALVYDRVPKGNVILFDINTDEEQYLSRKDKEIEATRLGIEIVPVMYEGMISTPEEVLIFLEKQSILGGQKVEGVVIKNYAQFGRDKKVLMGKYVSEQFKEVNRENWKEANPQQGDIITRLINAYKTPARWNKAVLHLEERGELERSPRDIGKLINEVKADLKKECEEEIKQAFYDWGIGNILRGAVTRLPEWYKEELLKLQFHIKPENQQDVKPS